MSSAEILPLIGAHFWTRFRRTLVSYQRHDQHIQIPRQPPGKLVAPELLVDPLGRLGDCVAVHFRQRHGVLLAASSAGAGGAPCKDGCEMLLELEGRIELRERDQRRADGNVA